MTQAAPIRRVGDWFKLLARSIVELYRRGFALFLVAPLVLALVIVPEFLQHVVEIHLGMFDSRAAAHALGNDPLRWAFGYAKLTGLGLAFFAAARFWWTRENGGRWWDLRDLAWSRLMIGLLIWGGIPFLPELLKPVISHNLYLAMAWGLSLLVFPFLFLVLGALFGDREPTLRQYWTRGWPALIMLAVLLPLAFVPAQWLHGLNHKLAIGSPLAIVWPLMIFDSLLVGLLAGLTGTALYLGYAGFAAGRRAA